MNTAAVIRQASFALPTDPFERAAYLSTRIGTFVTLTSGDFEVARMLVTVIQPARFADHAAPVVVIDNGLERVAGPVLAGDQLI